MVNVLKKVTVYTAPDCPHSKSVLEFFRERGVTVEEKCILDSQEIRDELQEISGAMAIPVTVIGDNVIVGGLDRRTERRLSRALEG